MCINGDRCIQQNIKHSKHVKDPNYETFSEEFTQP